MVLTNRKFLITFLLSAFLLIIAVCAVVFFSYLYAVRKDTPVETVGEVIVEPSGEKMLGQKLEVYALFKCPWHRYPAGADFSPGKGARLVGSPEIEVFKYRLGYCVWKVFAHLKPYRTGMIPKGELTVSFNESSTGRTDDRTAKLEIPSFEVKPIPVEDSKLALAGHINSPAPSYLLVFLTVGGIILVIVIIGIYFAFSRRAAKEDIALTMWGEAVAKIAMLREQLKNGKLDCETCFSHLTDIVRDYLEKRFNLHAPRQTTYEFLRDLEKYNSPLAESHRHFLKEFMTSADLVKFAKLPGDEYLLGNALDKAETLIVETKPPEEKEKYRIDTEKHKSSIE